LRISSSARPLAAALSVFALICGSLILARALGYSFALGALSQHMFDHIALLGLAAPASAWVLQRNLPPVSGRMLAAAAAIQIALIWIWHLPPVFEAAQADLIAHLVMVGSLFAAGLFFWCAVLGVAARARWQAILGLLITGKLFCLFAAILVFSPRPLYELANSHAHHGGHGAYTALADQQLAGLIMIAVCPLTYVAAGIAIAVRWISALELAYPEIPKRSALVIPLLLLLAGCSDVQSALHPASLESAEVTRLSWTLFVGGTLIFLIVMGLLVLAALGSEKLRGPLGNNRAIVLGGVAFPVVVLTALLGYGLWMAWSESAEAKAAQDITVQGEQWWWRVTYKQPDASATALSSANEIRIAAGRPVRLQLTSADVIHSFWVPALAGKIDLIPGRTNTLTFTPTKTGTYRGQCAEYCGGPHAMMALRVVVMEPEAYDEWLKAELRPAASPADDQKLVRGQEVFKTACVVCHEIRGTNARGRLGPDLTHLASRGALAGEVLPMSAENIDLWLRENDRLKPNNRMPEFGHLPSDDLSAIVAYLASLK